MKTLVLLAALCFLGVPASFARISQADYQHAVELFNQEQFDEAIAMLKTSLDEDPNQAMIYNLLGMIYLKQNESIASAIGSFEQALRIDPNYADVYFNLASIYAGSANRPELAAEYFKKTLEVDPKYVKAYFGLGWFTLTTQEEPLKAAEYFQKAIDYFPDFPEAYYGLGMSYIQMGKAPLALQSVSQLRALGREDLASYLESVLRGGKPSEMLQEEVKSEPASGSAPPVPSEVSGNPVSGPSSGPTGGAAVKAKAAELPGSTNPPENSNPFQLN